MIAPFSSFKPNLPLSLKTVGDANTDVCNISNEKIKDYCYYAVVVQAPSGCAKPKGFTCVNFNPVIEEQERVFIP